ncbi:MAG: hypothetical protein WCJ33_02080 [Pseudomonadota bacterium]
MNDNIYLEITFGRTAKVWWACFWRVFTIFILIGIFVGAIENYLKISGTLLVFISTIFSLFCMIAFFPISIKIMQLVLKKNFGEFRIALIKNE